MNASVPAPQAPRAAPKIPKAAKAALSAIVHRIFDGYPGRIAVELWNGEGISVGGLSPDFKLVIHSPRVLRDLILARSPLPLAHAYFNGRLDVEGSLYGALDLRHYFAVPRWGLMEAAAMLARLAHAAPANDGAADRVRRAPRALVAGNGRGKNRNAIAFHYDVSNAFYRLWLDERMVYSCAYFERPEVGLETAQLAKLDHVCRKLRLKPGERLLDVGCGWGALAIWAAQQYGVEVVGITLSRNQLELARERVRAAGLVDRVEIRLLDYRDLAREGVFDKVASIGMFEHVGLKNLPRYFGAIHDALKPGGLFLNHGITHDSEGWKRSISTAFINRYVFPDGELDTVSNVQREMERAGFELWDVEGLRPHYALTLREWVARLEARREEALGHVDESVYRVWRLYMAACALHFEQGDVGIYQILGSRREGARTMPAPVPWTRRDLYGRGGDA